MKTLIVVTYLCLVSFASFAQESEVINKSDIVLIDDINPAVSLNIDLTEKVLKAKRKKGKQLIATVRAVNLYVEVQKGEVVKYTASGSKGNILKISQNRLHPTCQLCVEDSEEGTLCWRVEASLVPDSKNE